MTVSIQQKLFGGFGLVLVLFMVSAVLSLSTMSSLNGHASKLGKQDLRAVNAIGEVRAGVFTVRAADGDNVHAPNAFVKAQTAAAVSRSRAAVLAALAVYSRSTESPADARAFASVRSDALGIIAGSDRALAFSARGAMAQAAAAYEAAQPFLQPFDVGSTAIAAARMKSAQRDVAAAQSSYSDSRAVLIVMALLSLALGIGVALVLSQRITRRVRALQRAADGIAEGDVDQSVSVGSDDELGQTAEAFGRMTAYIKDLAAVADRLADGDLTVDVQPRSERDLLGNSLRRLVDKLAVAIGRVSTQANSVTTASEQMAAISEESGKATGEIARAVGDVAQGTERQVRLVEDARRSAQEVTRRVSESAESARVAAAVANQARQAAEDGVGAAEQANQAMG